MRKRSGRDLLTPAAIIIAGLMVSSAIVWTSHDPAPIGPVASVASPPASSAPAAPQEPAVDVAEVTTDGEPFIGDAKAPATMAYWFDYQCPFCREEETTVLPHVIADYVATGKLRIVFKDFQFLGADSQTAALIARAVWEADPSKFAAWHRAMFDHQDGENTGWGSKDDVLALTKTIPGLDEAKVEQLLAKNSPLYQKAIDASLAEGSSMGVGGTPAFVVGKRFANGAIPYAQFKKLIDAALLAKNS